jgi:hypothetical protein
MRTRLTVGAAMALLVLVVSGAGAQQSKGTGELTVEERFLRNIEFQILREQAFSDDREMKLLVLDNIGKMVDEGRISANDTQYVFMLEYLAMEGISRTVRDGGAGARVLNAFPDVRRQACNLLGRIGGDVAADALLTVLLQDDEYMVKSEAAYGLGQIGLDKDGAVLGTLIYTLDRMDPTRPDNNFAMAVILGMEKLAAKTNGIRDPAAYRTLVKIASGNYIRTVKQKALQVLEALKAYN